jgi:dienelactone hydrolase
MLEVLSVLLVAATIVGASEPAPRAVDVTARDGTVLRGTYYPAAAPGPGVLLLHMCNTTRTSWEPLGRALSDAGIHALAVDYRGFGESAGERFDSRPPQDRQRTVVEKWPGDVDAALAFLASQAGVDKSRLGAAGGSCGVNQAVHLAERQPVKSLALLAGATDAAGRVFLQRESWLPIFASAAADDQFDADAPRSMQWLLDLSGNPRNRFVGFADGRHGTEIFGPHPELPRQIVEWFTETLVTAPADATAAVEVKPSPAREFWAALDSGDVQRAVEQFHDARKRDPSAFLFPEFVMNQACYERLQAGKTKEAIALFTLNVEAYPQSANARDSLGDGYLADGQSDLALAAARKSLELLPGDKANEQVKQAIRKSAEGKIEKIAGATK